MKNKYVLSLDGGGVRALSSVIFLNKLEKKLKTPLHKKFDLFIGTSAGAVSCLALSVNKMDTKQLLEFWSRENLNKILPNSSWEMRTNNLKSAFGLRRYGSKYDDEGKLILLKNYFEEKKMSESAKPVCALCYDVEKRKPVILSNFNNPDLLVVDVANATSAAPTYFPTARVKEKFLIDGAIVANHPSLHGFVEARKIYPNAKIKVLSIGTGLDRKPIPGEESQSWGTIGWLRNNLFGLMAESSLDHELAEGILGEDYLRVNSELKDINPQLDDNSKENIEKIIEMGHSWWKIYGEKSLNLING